VPDRDTPLSAIFAWRGGRRHPAVTDSYLARRAAPLLDSERDDPPRRRLVFEATTVFVCLLALYLLQQRGLGAATDGVAFDPLLAAVLSGLPPGSSSCGSSMAVRAAG
jgi:hypothetical protein